MNLKNDKMDYYSNIFSQSKKLKLLIMKAKCTLGYGV